MDSAIAGADILLQSLQNHGVSTIFGYPGSCVMTILDCLYRDKGSINHVLVRHEQGAVYAAQGYALASGKTGVALVTSGPGATNTATGIADAMASGTPLVVITGQVHSSLLGTDAFQEVDIIGIARSMTKWVFQVRSAGEISSAVAHAFYIASTGRPGPVLLDITKDAQTEKAIYVSQKTDFIRGYEPKSEIGQYALRERSLPIQESLTKQLIKFSEEIDLDLILVLDTQHCDASECRQWTSNMVLQSDTATMGFGLPAAIGAKYAAPNRTVCLITDSMRFQATIQELGVILQSGIEIKIVLLYDTQPPEHDPDYILLASAYGIAGEVISAESDWEKGIQKMLLSQKTCLLQIQTCSSYSKIPSFLA